MARSLPPATFAILALLLAVASAHAAPTQNAGKTDAAPEVGSEDRLAVFVLQRGFYLSGDLGLFATLGGVNGHSRPQPFLAVQAGLDLGDHLGIQLSFSSGYASANAISRQDLPGAGGQEVGSYSLFNFGGELVGALRPSERFAIEPKVGGGLTRLDPLPTDPGNLEKTLPALVPHVVAGVDFKYLTLLTDFSAGVSLSGYYVFGAHVPALSAAFVVRYTL